MIIHKSQFFISQCLVLITIYKRAITFFFCTTNQFFTWIFFILLCSPRTWLLEHSLWQMRWFFWISGQVHLGWGSGLHLLKRVSNMSTKKRTWGTRVLFSYKWTRFTRRFRFSSTMANPFPNPSLLFSTLRRFGMTEIPCCLQTLTRELRLDSGLIMLTLRYPSSVLQAFYALIVTCNSLQLVLYYAFRLWWCNLVVLFPCCFLLLTFPFLVI